MVYLFIFLNLMYMSVLEAKPGQPFEAMFKVLFPYDVVAKEYDGMLIIFNVALTMLIMSLMVKRIDEQLNLNKYIITRTTELRAWGIQVLSVLKVIVKIMLIKVAVDCMWSYPKGMQHVKMAIMMELSTLLSICIWGIMIYILNFVHMQPKFRYFLVIVIVVISQIMSAYDPMFSLIVPGSPDISVNPKYWLIVKTVALIDGLVIMCMLAKRYECLEDCNGA